MQTRLVITTYIEFYTFLFKKKTFIRAVPFMIYNNWDLLKMTKVTVILNHYNIAIQFYKSYSCFNTRLIQKGTVFPC